MPDLAASWTFPLTEVRESKAMVRTGTPTDSGSAYELIGVDASIMGGLRPHPGFLKVHQFQDDAVILDFFPVDVRVGANSYAYGFVLRTDNGDTTANIVFEYRVNNSSSWTTAPIATSIDATAQMDVTTEGRFVFVCVAGQPTIMFFMDDSDISNPIIISRPGAGKRPTLYPDDQNLGYFGITDAESEPARAQIILTDYLPSTSGFYVTPPQADSETRALAAGDYAFAFRLYNSLTGRWSALSTIAPIQSADFTGSGSSSSATSSAKYATIDLLYRKTDPEIVGMDAWDYCIIYRSVRVQSGLGINSAAILHADQLFKLSDFEVIDQPVGGDYRRAVCWYTLEDKALVFQVPYTDASTFEEEVPYAGACLGYEGCLLLSYIRNADTTPQILGQGPVKGLGEVRWSSLVEMSPELFPPFNRYVPQVPSNEIIRFLRVTGQAVGFSKDRQYHIRKESIYLRVVEMHEGYGLVHPRAVTTVGSLVYFMTPKGIKVVDPDGQLESLKAFDHLVLGEWAGTLNSVRFAYDAYSSVLYVVNTELEQSALIWFNTSTPTELYDTNFTHVGEGVFLEDPDDTSSALVSRAFFLGPQNKVYVADSLRTKTVTGATVGTGKPRVTTLDFIGDSVINSFSLNYLASTVIAVGATMHSSMVGCYVYVAEATNPAYIGRKAKILKVDGTTTLTVDVVSQLGGATKLTISPVYQRWTGHQLGLQDDNQNTFGPRDMHRVRHIDSIVAVFSNVSGAQASTGNAHYVAGIYKSNDQYPTVRAMVRDLDGELPDSNTIRDYEPTAAVALGVSSGDLDTPYGYDSSMLYPTIEVMIPDLDYRMLSVKIDGKIRSSDRTQRGS